MTNNQSNDTNNSVPMTKAVKIFIAVVVSLALLIGASLVYFTVQDKKVAELAQTRLLEQQALQTAAEEQAKIEKEKESKAWEEKRLEEIKSEAEKANAEKPIEQQQEDKPHTETKSETDKGIEYNPEYTKPEPPPPPKAEGSTSDPNSKPEYKPEDTVKPPPANNKPKDGAKNEKGETYIEGFGWVPPPAGVKGEVIDNSGWENSEKVGY